MAIAPEKRFTPEQIAAMSDKDIGVYASGGYGLAERAAFVRTVKDMAKFLSPTAPREAA